MCVADNNQSLYRTYSFPLYTMIITKIISVYLFEYLVFHILIAMGSVKRIGIFSLLFEMLVLVASR